MSITDTVSSHPSSMVNKPPMFAALLGVEEFALFIEYIEVGDKRNAKKIMTVCCNKEERENSERNHRCLVVIERKGKDFL